MWLDPNEQSMWAYNYCKNVRDLNKIALLIEDWFLLSRYYNLINKRKWIPEKIERLKIDSPEDPDPLKGTYYCRINEDDNFLYKLDLIERGKFNFETGLCSKLTGHCVEVVEFFKRDGTLMSRRDVAPLAVTSSLNLNFVYYVHNDNGEIKGCF